MVYLQSTGTAGECILRTESPGLTGAEIRLECSKTDAGCGNADFYG